MLLGVAPLTIPALWIVTSCFAVPFRVKRALLNLVPGPLQKLRLTVIGGHGRRARGVYALEAELFRSLGLPRPREFSWDLIPPVIGWLLIVRSLVDEFATDVQRGYAGPFGAAFYITFGLLLGLWGWRMQRNWVSRRHPQSPSWPTPAVAWLIDRENGSERRGKLSLGSDQLEFVAESGGTPFTIGWRGLERAKGGLVTLELGSAAQPCRFSLARPPLEAALRNSLPWFWFGAFAGLLAWAQVVPGADLLVGAAIGGSTALLSRPVGRRHVSLLFRHRRELWRALLDTRRWATAVNAWP